MLFHDVKYINQISYRLQRFKTKKINELWNFSCPLCGDSQKKASKTRGYFYVKQGKANFMCHNCGASMSFGSFLRDFDPNLYNQFIVETYGEKKQKDYKKEPQFPTVDVTKYEVKESVFDELKTLEELDAGHPARIYAARRMIPNEQYSMLRYAPKYIHWAAKHTDKFVVSKGTSDHPRLIIPWLGYNGEPTAYSARSFGYPDPKYYTIPLTDEKGFYGLDRVDLEKRIFVLEGALDAIHLPNAIAVGTSALWKFESDGLDVVYIPDRDIRNKEVMKIVDKMIKDGKQVCMLPDGLIGKDINEFVVGGLTSRQILDIINDNTFRGLEAQMKFTQWSKV